MQSTLTFRTNRDLFSNHYLTERLSVTDPWTDVPDAELQSAFENISALYESEEDRVEGYNEAQLERQFIRPVFEELGVTFEIEESVERGQRRPDYAFFADEGAREQAFERRDAGGNFYENTIAVADAKRWGRKLDTRGERGRDFENPSYQIHVYLQETPTQWAVLTNGRKWRLYYGPTSHRLDSYYEINLPTLLEQGGLEEFKYFYLFFRREAFVEDTSGECFLDDVYDESNTFAEALGEDLQDNIYEAIRVLAEGFLDGNNDLDEDDLDRIHDSSLIYLYRLIFVLYAESEGRELLPTDNDIYSEHYSLNQLKQTVADNLDDSQEHYLSWQTDLWDRLGELFDLINEGSKSRGIDRQQLHIPAYNGSLFRTNPDEDDSVEAKFIASHEVGNAYLAEVLNLLARREADSGAGKVFVDYSSLDIRHLGSIYEGLLEYQLNLADEALTLDDGEYTSADENDDVVVAKGNVYLTTDSGERKATGSYYTPEYVVEHIVENTLEPLVNDIREDFLDSENYGAAFAEEFANRVFELKILDPAMGSGHFLTSAVDYLAREIINAQERQAEQQGVESIDQSQDINWARRQVAQRCIYGVDLNPLAVELAKVSLWLRTLAAEQPLAFLDHHLKTGNSLVGSDIEEVLSNGKSETKSGQMTLQQSFARTRQQALEHVMDRFQDLLSIDNESLEDIKEMESAFEEVRKDLLYQRLLTIANVDTAEAFGLDVPSDAYERMAEALRDDSWEDIEDQAWFKNAQAIADEEHFFHWELEFPVAYYNDNGDKKGNTGFDAVIGNPPWLNAWRMTDEMPVLRDAIKNQFSSSELLEGHWDLFVPFTIKSLGLAREGGYHSFILPNLFLTEKYAKALRKSFFTEHSLQSILSFGEYNVFDEVERQCIVYVVEANNEDGTKHALRNCNSVEPFEYNEVSKVDASVWLNAYNYQIRVDPDYVEHHVPILDKIDNKSDRFGQYLYVNVGATVSSQESGKFTKDDVVSEKPVGNSKKFFQGTNVARWEIDWSREWLDYREDEMSGSRQPEMFEAEKIVIRKRTDEGGVLAAAYDNDEMFCDDTVMVCCNYEPLEGTGATIEFDGFEKRARDLDLKYVLTLTNSTLMTWVFKNKFETGGLQGTYSDVWPQSIRSFPVPHSPSERLDSVKKWSDRVATVIPDRFNKKVYSVEGPQELLAIMADSVVSDKDTRNNINLDLFDYIGNYSDGPKLADFEGYQPAKDVRDSILSETTNSREGLRIGRLSAEETGGSVTIYATARYKPEDEDEYETDRWGYTTTEPVAAAEFHGLSAEKRALISEFVPATFDEGNIIEEARAKTSLLDRIKSITLPDIGDVRDDIERYADSRTRARNLENRIKETEEMIDLIVYQLFGLTEDEIEIVENGAS